MAAIGSVLANKYEILTEIGRGGMSVVYLAMDRNLNKYWAVKEVKREGKDANEVRMAQSLLVEAELLKRLDHPLIPRIVDIIQNDETIFIVMDYMTGMSLDKVLAERKKNGEGPLPQEGVINIGIQLCEALDYLHTQNPPIIYRDMKPSNVMLKNPEEKDPKKWNIALFDFGIAREYKEGKTGDTCLYATRAFAAPEQLNRTRQSDARTDIYSLGLTLYNLVTGHSLATDNELLDIRDWVPRLSGGLNKILFQCMELQPENRFQSCAELKYALERYEDYDPIRQSGLRKKLNLFVIPVVLSVACLLGGMAFHGLYKHENTATYDATLAMAEKEQEQNASQSYYIEAATYDPADIRAYEGLVSLYKKDTSFTTDEREILYQQVQPNMQSIKERSIEDYVQLCYDIGSLYWFYYDYGDTGNNQTTRMTYALPWFLDAQTTCLEEGYAFGKLNAVNIFCDIATFYRDYEMNVMEAADVGTYIAFWDTLVELREYLAESSEQELIEWESYKVIVYALENNMSKFKSDGVTREQIESMIADVKADVELLEATTDITLEIKEYIVSRLADDSGISRNITANYGS